MFFFFFSSRRRHTRFDCDWSSDVCSSDLSADEAPNVSVKCPELLLHFEESARVTDGGVDFQAVADDSGVAKQFANLLLVVACDFLWVESVKHFAIPRAFF